MLWHLADVSLNPDINALPGEGRCRPSQTGSGPGRSTPGSPDW